ncbi:MAG: SipW-dependent-type signal peptide-containing protein [Clostridia bacterium]
MKYKVLSSLTIIAATIALVGGATMAWFTDSADIPEASFTAGTVEIIAGQTVKAEGGDNIDYHEYLAEFAAKPEKVVDSNQGPAGADEVKKIRSNPEAVLDYEKESIEQNFFSLGFGGWIIVKFKEPIRSGDTVVVVEDTWGPPYPVESAKVYVAESEDGPWHEVGTATNYDMISSQTINLL